jgi:hypothetical protein
VQADEALATIHGFSSSYFDPRPWKQLTFFVLEFYQKIMPVPKIKQRIDASNVTGTDTENFC